jgi:hypothetical protein
MNSEKWNTLDSSRSENVIPLDFPSAPVIIATNESAHRNNLKTIMSAAFIEEGIMNRCNHKWAPSSV